MNGITLILALVSISFTAQPQPQSPAAQIPSIELPAELDRVLRDYEKAWIANDAKGLAILFAPDGFVLRGGHPPVRWRDGIERAYAGAGGPLHLRALQFKAEGTTGWIIGAYSSAAEQADSGKFVLALTREPGGPWLIAADIDTLNRARGQ